MDEGICGKWKILLGLVTWKGLWDPFSFLLNGQLFSGLDQVEKEKEQ
jgi:hypothetical protein